MRQNTFRLTLVEAARWAQRLSLSPGQRTQATPGGLPATVMVGRVTKAGRVVAAIPELEINEEGMRDEG